MTSILLVEDDSALAETLRSTPEREAARLGDAIEHGKGVQVHW